jgi:hypothetical protein
MAKVEGTGLSLHDGVCNTIRIQSDAEFPGDDIGSANWDNRDGNFAVIQPIHHFVDGAIPSDGGNTFGAFAASGRGGVPGDIGGDQIERSSPLFEGSRHINPHLPASAAASHRVHNQADLHPAILSLVKTDTIQPVPGNPAESMV